MVAGFVGFVVVMLIWIPGGGGVRRLCAEGFGGVGVGPFAHAG